MYKQIEIQFGDGVLLPGGWSDTFREILQMTGRFGWEITYDPEDGAVRSVTAESGKPFDFPPGFDRLLDALVDMACKAYDKQNPTMHMWPGGHGSRPVWSKQDAAFLGKTAEAGVPDDGEPMWDDSVYQISCSVQEDVHGHNEWNPKRDAIRGEAILKRKRKQLAETRQIGVYRVQGSATLYTVEFNQSLTNEQFEEWKESIK